MIFSLSTWAFCWGFISINGNPKRICVFKGGSLFTQFSFKLQKSNVDTFYLFLFKGEFDSIRFKVSVRSLTFCSFYFLFKYHKYPDRPPYEQIHYQGDNYLSRHHRIHIFFSEEIDSPSFLFSLRSLSLEGSSLSIFLANMLNTLEKSYFSCGEQIVSVSKTCQCTTVWKESLKSRLISS